MGYYRSDPYQTPQNAAKYRITLSCGHAIPARNQPWRADTKYGCTANQGCGYSLAWVSWTDGRTTWQNLG